MARPPPLWSSTLPSLKPMPTQCPPSQSPKRCICFLQPLLSSKTLDVELSEEPSGNRRDLVITRMRKIVFQSCFSVHTCAP